MKNETKLHIEENEKHLLIDHNYDGIQELNHPLPSWWQFTFYGAIIFSTAYFVYYSFMNGPSLRDEFNKDYAVIVAAQADFKKKEGLFNPEIFSSFNTAEGIKKGEEIFTNNCVACHLEKGKGDIGPNLTDEYWLWAKGTPETIYPVVFNGVVENGMPNWSEVLSRDEIYQVVAYVQTLHHTHQPGGKDPQGNKVDGN
ncbi:MAG: c-type cytochrome [Bdellovibrionales bacterium]|nr:c-type cytochrome [Bdellovibrionales bacterium]